MNRLDCTKQPIKAVNKSPKHKQSDAIKAHVDEFLSAGGSITMCENPLFVEGSRRVQTKELFIR